MKLLILGDGRMGRAVERVAARRGHEGIGPLGRKGAYDDDAWGHADAAVDFTVGASVPANVDRALATKTPIVVGTTGWDGEREGVLERAAAAGGTVVWGANFSIGFHAMHHLSTEAARWVAAFEEFDVAVFEHHHRHKRDAPSGSALVLADSLLAELPGKTHWVSGTPDGAIDPSALQVASLRAGAEPGTHRVDVDGAFESVSIEHRVRDREVFAVGAVFAAEQAVHRQGVVQFRDLVADTMRKGGTSWT